MPKVARLAAITVVVMVLNVPVAPVVARAPGQVNAPQPAQKVIRFGRLVVGTGAVLTNAIVVVEGDRIKSVGGATSIPAGTEVIDLSTYTGIPGLIDMHMHLRRRKTIR